LIERELFPALTTFNKMTDRKMCEAKDITFVGPKLEFTANPCRLIEGGNKDDHFPLNPFTETGCNIWNAGESCYSFVVPESFTHDGRLNNVLARSLGVICRKAHLQISKQNRKDDFRRHLCNQIKNNAQFVFYFNRPLSGASDKISREKSWARAEFWGSGHLILNS